MSAVRFFNVWDAESTEARDQLVDVMRNEVRIFTSQPGFRSLRAWVSDQGNRVIVEADWASQQAFDDAVGGNPDAQAGRQLLETLAVDAPGVFSLAFSQTPNAPSDQPESHDERRWD